MKIEYILPYPELEIEILNYKCDYVGIHYSKINGHYFIGDKPYFIYEGGSTGKTFGEFKPIFRPLSDITKPITHAGETFVPIDRMHEIAFNSLLTAPDLELINGDIYDCEYWIVIKLLEWHFNVFQLPEDLWVDINTL